MLALHTFKEAILHKEVIMKPSFVESYDVIIAGGGTAGSIAAITLAKHGHKVAVIEQLHALGGVHSHMMYAYYMGNTGGFYEELDKQIISLEAQCAVVDTYGTHPFLRQYVYEETLQANDGRVSYEAVIIGIFVEDETIVGVRYVQEGRQYDIQAQYIVDATANAWIARLAGVETTIGRAMDQQCQPFSNVRMYYDQEKQRIEINNFDAGYMKAENIHSYSDAIVRSSHNCVYASASSLQKEIPLAMSPMLGIRESYTVKAEKQITMQDVISGKIAKEPLFYSYANIDNHAKDMAFESQPLCDWMVALSLWGAKVSFGIPKEALLPKGTKNLVMVGRHIGIDHDLASQMRMMRDCQKSGEAAAILLHTALDYKTELRKVRYSWMHEQLIQYNCLSEQDKTGIYDNPPIDEMSYIQIPKDIIEVKAAFKSDRPGFAMLFAWREKLIGELREWLHETNTNIRVNSAIVLGLLDDEQAIDCLLETIQSDDVYMPKTSKSYTMFRTISAIYILGRLGAQVAMEPLLDMLKHADTLRSREIIFDKLFSSIDDYHFQYVTHCIRALYDIAMKHSHLQAHIHNEIMAIINAKSFCLCITLKANSNDIYNMIDEVKKYCNWREQALEKGR